MDGWHDFGKIFTRLDCVLLAGAGDYIEMTEKFTFDPKAGIDNPALVITEETDVNFVPSPRRCRLKRSDEETFGFCLRLEEATEGHVIRQVEPWSLAERSGLQDGDRVLEINGVFVDHLEHNKVAQRIQASGLVVSLLVLAGPDYERARALGIDLRPLAWMHGPHLDHRTPRLCYITADVNASFGFSIQPTEGLKDKVILNTTVDGPAEAAGVQNGDRLIWIDGTDVSDLTRSALNKMVRKCHNHVTLLVIDSASEESYTRRGITIVPAMAKPSNLPHFPHKLFLTQGPEGYGFLLRQERTSAGRIAHFLQEVDQESPAEHAGMCDGDLLLAVNGDPVEGVDHEDIVAKIRASGSQVTLTVIDCKGSDFYAQLRLSPLAFVDHLELKEEESRVQEEVPTF
ncbi:Na(+)/H(+) exchange regulatory cofactor NHE-RF4 isoform X1 [Erpetoichthys calabaricus]|uniref:Na(+)/H(+) exchange regulatory cofactor NHE-RF4 isoform X1 n=1 Tax=Erpetoichthys calabaricus TaxID=27687 RepID=UPI0022345DC6|nr:Na(+)/H(+) exchange regulatory cofactor NHE-RF4 isoform X1 [Erpetoichthys calabaricus]